MENITKTKLQNAINKALTAEKAGFKNFGLFNLNTGKTTVQFKYLSNGLFSMIDLHDPVRGTNGYPKIWDGDINAFFNEFNRELDYINNCVHA